MNGASDAVLRRIEDESRREFLPILGRERGGYLETLVRDRQPRLAVEIGAMTGYATILIARNLPPDGRLIAVEIDREAAEAAEGNVAEAGLSDRVEIRRGDAAEVLGGISGPVDLLVLDGRRSGYFGCLKKIEDRLAPRAVIFANGTGIDCRGCASYLDHVRTSPHMISHSRPFGGDAVEVSVLV